MIILIIVILVVVILFVFISDKEKAKKKNVKRGGLAVRFPNFVEFCNKYSTTLYEGLEFVKDDGQYIEYRYPLPVTNNKTGYFYLGLQNSFGTYLYTYAVSHRGRKINGFLKEIHNGRHRTRVEDPPIFTYKIIFDGLIKQMEDKERFAEKFIDE